MLVIVKSLSNWSDLYDLILLRSGQLTDEKAKEAIAPKLKDWEERNMPRLLELKSRLLISENPERQLLGVRIRQYLVQDIETIEKRRPILDELIARFGELFDLVEDLGLVPELPRDLGKRMLKGQVSFY